VHVVQLGLFVDPQRRAPERLLQDWYTVEDLAAGVAAAGERVTVVLASMVEGEVSRRDVDFLFIAPSAPDAPLTQSAAFRSRLRELAPDVMHVHGLGFSRDVLALRELLPKVPILLQDHADRVPRFWRRASWRRAVAVVDGVSFCAREQIEPFSRAGMFAPHVRLFEIPESTSRFETGDAAAARAATGLHGDPALLWVGHLDRNKDPLTLLDAVAAFASEMPGVRLWCCYGSAPLLPAVESRIARDPSLRERVHLLGRVPHQRVEHLMQAADLFVLASHREGGNTSLIEALATGLLPVVTDIPSSRSLLGNGPTGILWRRGNVGSLHDALREGAATIGAATRARVRGHFDEHLSGVVLGRRFAAAYRDLALPWSMTAAGVLA
jgi:glycosyltransferase involved in cell wall biosynthesis